MSDAQSWTLIVGFLSAIGALIVVTTSVTLRTVRAEIGVLGATVNGRIDSLEARLEAKIDHLDRDVQIVVTRLMEG